MALNKIEKLFLQFNQTGKQKETLGPFWEKLQQEKKNFLSVY